MHSFVSCQVHCVFATHKRERWLTPDIQPRLWSYLGRIARENKMTAVAVGGVEDHVHMLIALHATLSIAKALQLLKGNSSKWLHETFPALRQFKWQEGYGAFSIGVSGVAATRAYIAKQAEHHRHVTFREEVEVFLRKHNMTWVERDLED
jgi:putative transposase